MMIPNKFNGYQADGRRLYRKGGDGGAGAARKQEEDRQARINEAVKGINAIFDSAPVTAGVNAATSYDPNATYYTADGKQWNAPTKSEQFWDDSEVVGEGNGIQGAYKARTVADTDAIKKAIAGGQLFTGLQTTAPTKTRNDLYAEQKQAVFDINKRDVDRQYREAERQNRFGLARSGLMGGSVDVDSNAELQDKTNEGLMKAAGLGEQAAADLKTADERSRQSLISMAQSGIDTGTAQQMALRQLDATAQQAAGNRAGATIGSLFNDMSQAYLMRQYGQGMRAGQQAGQQWYGVSSPQQTYGGIKG